MLTLLILANGFRKAVRKNAAIQIGIEGFKNLEKRYVQCAVAKSTTTFRRAIKQPLLAAQLTQVYLPISYTQSEDAVR